MDKKHLQTDILEASYNPEKWREVLSLYFGAKKFHNIPQAVLLPPNDLAESATELGSFYTADERLIGIYEVKLTSNAWINKNRVGLRNLLRQVYKYDVDGALIVFVKGDKWRFSYVSEIRTEEGKKVTEPKRYTYLFGQGEKCRTAADRFQKLINKPIFLNDLYEAFSVEKLNRDFFKTYKEFYEKGVAYLASDKNYYNLLIDKNQVEKDKRQKPIRDFVKKLLGRIVFLHFLQKKGWLGCPPDSIKWGEGSKRFMHDLFATSINKEIFNSECLKTLFFETLNINRKSNNDVAPKTLWGGNKDGYRIPYLNGGLFDKDIAFSCKIDFTVDYFEKLFDFFESYNFTIDENDPYDSEIGIDPEMLGHIFENLLEENRERGAFYTPKEIVHYMCQESLIEYLVAQLPDVSLIDIELLIRNNKVADHFTEQKTAIHTNKKLLDLKLCDPAIGSGAFPMGMLKEIFECRRLLYPYLKTPEAFVPVEIKKEIIQKNIYGVDVDPGAVDIARLRFWLALVVDETEPQPLPNLDYKIMQGHSLLESFEGTDLTGLGDPDIEETFLSAGRGQLEIGVDFSLKKQSLLIFDQKSKTQLHELINDYYSYDETESTKYESKQFIKNEINQIVEGKLLAKFYLQKSKLSGKIVDVNNALSVNSIVSTDAPAIKLRKEKNLINLNRELDLILKEQNRLDEIIKNLHELEIRNDKPYFLWHLWFKEVFDKKGFDVVIGNPPYIQLQKIPFESEILQKANYSTFTRTGDIYCLFYEQGLNLLKPGGTLCYITSNTWMRTKFGELLRKYFAEKANPLKLLNFEDTKIFQTATVETNIILLQKSRFEGKLNALAVKSDYSVGTSINAYFDNNFIQLNYLPEDGWIILSKQDYLVKREIERTGKQLKEWNVEMNFALKSGFNDAFFIDESTKNSLIEQHPSSADVIKPLIRGRNIKKYRYHYDNKYILYVPWHFPLSEDYIQDPSRSILQDAEIQFKIKYPAVYDHLSRYKNDLLKRNQAETGIRYEWYALQRPSATFVKNYEKDKIVWLAITDKPAFALDTAKMYVTNPSYIMISDVLKYHLIVLNSKVVEWYFDKITSSTGQGTNQWTKMYMDQVPIPELSNLDHLLKFERLADYLVFLNDETKPSINPYSDNTSLSSVFDDVVNMMVYEIYFEQHLKEEQIDVLKFITELNFQPLTEDDNENAEIIGRTYKWLQTQENPIRNRIILSNIRSTEIIRRINSTTH